MANRYPGPARRMLASLIGHYTVAALLLLSVLVGIAWFVSAYLQDERATRFGHLREREEALAHLKILRSAIWTAEHHLQAYSLTSADPDRRQALQAIRNGHNQAQMLAKLPWTVRNNQKERAKRISEQFDRLLEAAQRLIDTRDEPDRLYPALGLMQDTLEPKNRNFLEATQRALKQMQGREAAPWNQAQTLFQEVRYYWSRMIGEFRLYMTRRVGLLGEDALGNNRATNVAQFHTAIEETLARLESLHRQQDLGLVVGGAITELGSLQASWFRSFEQVKELYANQSWRTDFPLITDTLYPLYEDIQKQISKIDQGLKASAQTEMAALSEAARRIALSPWALVGLYLFMVLLGFLYLRFWMLRPLSRLRQALNRQAEGQVSELAVNNGPLEIQDLGQSFHRMQEEVRSRQQALEYQAFRDPLTTLPNRSLLEQNLDECLRTIRENERGGALMMLDLDFFKEINDNFGHPAGDSVLQLVAERLSAELRDSDMVARFGGDEFCILLPDMSGEQAQLTAARLLRGLRPRMEVGEHTFHISGSFGIALFPFHGEDAETLIRRADMAMYQAKQKRQGTALFELEQDTGGQVHLTRTAELYEDLLEDCIPLAYQPQWSGSTGQLVGGEALIRWGPADRASLTPPEVLGMAQRAGVQHMLTQRIMNAAMRQAAMWQAEGGLKHMAVNLSTHDFQMEDLSEFIRRQLAAWELSNGTLELEITENDMMADPERARTILGELRSLGVRVAIDVYGTGYSSLAYLRGLPVDILKIDKSFVMDLAANPDNQAIVRSTIELGQNLGLELVAEGVEDADSLTLLEQWGCHRLQGFHLGKPMAPEDFPRLPTSGF